MTILEWAKANSKDGANYAELEELIEQENPLNKVKTISDAEVLMRENALLTSAFDSRVLKAVKNHDERFMADKLPGILKDEREKIRLELNPKETEDQKRLRELGDELAEQKRLRASDALKADLRRKASELKIPEDMADSFVVYGDNAVERLVFMADHIAKSVDEGIASGIKEKFKGREAPGAGNRDPNAKVIKRSDYDVMPPESQSKFFDEGGIVED